MTGQETPAKPAQPVPGPDGKPQPLGPAMALLIGQARIADPQAETPNPLRSFRIDIAADTLVQIDEQREKQDRMEMLTAFGAYLDKAAQVGALAPQMIPLMVEVGKYGLTAFKVGKQIEGTFDQALDQLKQQAAAGPPPDPAAMQEQAMNAAKAQVAQENATKEIGLTKRAADLDIREMKFSAEQAIAKQQADIEKQLREQEQGHAERELKMAEKETQLNTTAMQKDAEFAEKGASLEREATERSQSQAALNEETLAQLAQTTQALMQGLEQMDARLDRVEKVAKGAKRIIRNPQTGRAEGIEPVVGA